jgi:hypothetical protein
MIPSRSQDQEQPNNPGSDGSRDMLSATTNTNSVPITPITPDSLGYRFPALAQGSPPSFASVATIPHNSSQNGDGDLQINAIEYASESWDMEQFWEDSFRFLPVTPVDQDTTVNASRGGLETQEDREDEVERVAYLLHQQVFRTLSITGETISDPWKRLIWPLAKEYPAVYHGLGALTFFGMSKQQAQLRDEGTRHAIRGSQLLSENVIKGEIPLDAALAATLCLALSETWDEESSSSGFNHIRDGGMLLEQIRSNQDTTTFGELEAARLDFLAHTWTYLDVLARFTCSELSQLYPANTLSLDLIGPGQDPSKLDPLMGYSTTLFPMMRRVADLINKVKAREAPRNSPSIISQAIELRQAIQQWTLPIDLETIDEPSQVMTDAIQTAEAYRWSTLMILYQAVPELPNLTSYGELAQKILVYLATIPLSSTTLIVHIFPLMIAGCDAVEEEDRQFIRERWYAMSQRMVTGIVDRCLKITEEIWKRREEYLLSRGLAFTSNGRQILSDSMSLSKDIASFIGFDTSPGANTAGLNGHAGQTHERFAMKGNDFPISAAFKKGVDMLTRSGCTEYTVRGRLHWLGVMKDWNWQGKVASSIDGHYANEIP